MLRAVLTTGSEVDLALVLAVVLDVFTGCGLLYVHGRFKRMQFEHLKGFSSHLQSWD